MRLRQAAARPRQRPGRVGHMQACCTSDQQVGVSCALPPPLSLSSLSLYDETLSIYLSIYLSISRTHTQGHTHIHSLPPAPHTPAQTNIAALQRPAGATVSV